jgi:hypothetical protein
VTDINAKAIFLTLTPGRLRTRCGFQRGALVA